MVEKRNLSNVRLGASLQKPMNKLVFSFRNRHWHCTYLIDGSEYPYYIFVFLSHADLTKEFGEEITIKTDFKSLLPKKDEYPALRELRQAILTSVLATRRGSSFEGRRLLS